MPVVQVSQDENRQLQNIANILASSKKIVMITGAGISTNCGIPDFRSADGLYALIQSQYTKASTTLVPPPEVAVLSHGIEHISSKSQRRKQRLPSNVKGKDMFDVGIWRDPARTSAFYTFIGSLRKQIKNEIKHTTPTHRLIRTIRDSQKLVRCYTQNIDGLESRLGLCMDLDRGRGNKARFTAKSKSAPYVPASRTAGGDMDGGCEVVPLHGDLAVLRCTLCQKTCGWEEQGREAIIQRGKAPECFSCATSSRQRYDQGKRVTKIGSLRPNIVLYGEEHPCADAVGSITTHDLALAPDVLLILGTSLHVQGVKTLVKEFAKSVHARAKSKGKVIFVNLSKPSESMWNDSIDYWVSMDCDAWVDTLRRHRPDIWHVQTQIQARVVKKDTKRPVNVSTPKGRKEAGPNQKQNVAFRRGQDVSTPIKRSPGRPITKPLPVISIDVINTVKAQGCGPPFSSEFPKENILLQLPTPPPSNRKHTAQEQRRKRSRPLGEPNDPVTPSKRLRSIADSEDDLSSLDTPRPSEDIEEESPSAKRRKTAINIWED
ncbi:MAG: hypothetical protein Q9184_005689 [Pyrenodesmia sp. 2 TL-2023]